MLPPSNSTGKCFTESLHLHVCKKGSCHSLCSHYSYWLRPVLLSGSLFWQIVDSTNDHFTLPCTHCKLQLCPVAMAMVSKQFLVITISWWCRPVLTHTWCYMLSLHIVGAAWPMLWTYGCSVEWLRGWQGWWYNEAIVPPKARSALSQSFTDGQS